jgi:glycosyltransferase involved in cell wall biosynthesis
MVDFIGNGHHDIYMKTIYDYIKKDDAFEIYMIRPEEKCYGKEGIREFPKKTNPIGYCFSRLKWLKELSLEIKKIDPDMIHIMTGDMIYSLGAMGIRTINHVKSKKIITMHHIPKGILRTIMLKSMLRRADAVVVHSEFAFDMSEDKDKVKNKSNVIEYPAFHKTKNDTVLARRSVGIANDTFVFLFAGVITPYKGLDLLVEAMEKINKKYLLCICGKEMGMTKDRIKEIIRPIEKKVRLELKLLTDEEMGLYLDACDCVVAPYRKEFNGASGPVTEGIWRGKVVIVPSHGILGKTIGKYRVGITYKTDDMIDLRDALEKALEWRSESMLAEEGNDFRKRLEPSVFLRKHKQLYEKILGK